jgi:hypothetical protein
MNRQGQTARTWVDALREAVVDLVGWLAGLDWLTTAAWLLTLGCLGAAILDSYTSLCVVGGTLGHIGSAAACPDFHGWDTRVFPLAVDMGWGGALFAVIRLARTIGMKSWRWVVVVVFEVTTAAFTIAGNAFHGAVLDGATADLQGPLMVLVNSVASAVPGVVAVGSGFTLSVLVSARAHEPRQATRPAERTEEAEAVRVAEATPPADRQEATAGGRRPASEVQAMVKAARERRTEELGREPSAEEVAAQVTRDGHPITASRVRTYLATLRAAERARPEASEEEVVAWHAR